MELSNPLTRFFLAIDKGISWFRSKKWHYAITLPLILLLLYLTYFAFCYKEGIYDTNIYYTRKFGLRDQTCYYAMQWFYTILIVLVVVYLIFEICLRIINGKKFTGCVLIISSIALVAFGFTTSVNAYGWHHDSGYLGTGNHWSIIYEIFKTDSIPAPQLTNQYYQYKFFHGLMAFFMKFNGSFVSLGEEVVGNVTLNGVAYEVTLTDYQLLEMNRILMAYIGILTLIGIYKVYELLLKGGIKFALAASLTLMIPELWYINFFVNNDGLALCFSVWALVFTLYYYQHKDWPSIIATAFCIGLGMMAKINAGLVALPIGVILLYMLIKQIRGCVHHEKGLMKFLFQMGAFAIVVLPLGLWIPLYYYFVYDVPFGYVVSIGGDGMRISMDTYNWFERFFLYPSSDLFKTPFNIRWHQQVNGVYVDVWGDIDFNCWTAFVKTLCFEEQGDIFWAWSHGFEPLQFLWVLWCISYYYVLIFAFLLGMIGIGALFIKRIVKTILAPKGSKLALWKGDFFLLLIMAVMGIGYGVYYIIFCYFFPVGCTQNARYLMLFLIPAFVGVSYSFTSWGKTLVDFIKKKRQEKLELSKQLGDEEIEEVTKDNKDNNQPLA